MRSPLSQFQTPTTPRRVVGFFRFGVPVGCPTGLITQSTSGWLILFEPTLSIVDAAENKWFVDCCQCRFSVQTLVLADLFHRDRNSFSARGLRVSLSLFCTALPQYLLLEVEPYTWRRNRNVSHSRNSLRTLSSPTCSRAF